MESGHEKVSLALRQRESGATAIEYGLIAAGIAVVIIGAVQLAGDNLNITWGLIAAAML